MKHMIRRLVVVAVAAWVLLPPAGAQAQAQGPARFQQVVEITVKSGQEGVYENYVKKIVEAANKAGTKMTWTTYQVTAGKPGGTYRVVLSFRSWADRDAWTSVPALLSKAFGQAEAERLMKEGGSTIDRSHSEVWEILPEASANVGGGPAGSPAAYVRVAVTRVQPALAAAYEALLAKFKAAYEASPQKPVIGRAVLRMGPNSGSTYRRTQAFNRWSELDGMAPGPMLVEKHFGAPQAEKMVDEVRRMTVFQQEYIIARRADLSRPAPPTSSQ